MMIKHSESNDVLKWTCAVLLIFFFFWTKRKLKWAASVKHTPLSLTYAEWLMEVRERPHRRHYHQQKMLFRVWEADLGLYCFLLPVKAFLLMCGFRRGGLHQCLQDMDIWRNTCQRRGRGTDGGGVGEA